MAEHQTVARPRRRAELALVDLAVGAADADPTGAAAPRLAARASATSATSGRLGLARCGDERLQRYAAVRPPSMVRIEPVTNAAASDAR